jgi:peptide deformylase
LSVPGFYERVFRHEKILVEALDQNGDVFQLGADGLLAICIQHEMDHLDGKLFVDYLSPAKRQLLRKKLLKQQKLQRQ